jgi:hypothetical protein
MEIVSLRWILCLLLFSVSSYAEQGLELKNSQVTAEFGCRGLKSLVASGSDEVIHFASEEFAITIDGRRFKSDKLTPLVKAGPEDRVTYSYQSGEYGVNAVYELKPGWHFVSKQLQVVRTPNSRFVVGSVEPLYVVVAEAISSVFIPGTYLPQFGDPAQWKQHVQTHDFGAFLRFLPQRGLMVLAQNPFLEVSRQGQSVELRYAPEMQWQTDWGPFVSDLACIGPYRLTGQRISAQMVYEWKIPPPSVSDDGADEAEIQAFRDCVAAFLIHPPAKPISVEVGWTLNDYQIDVSKPEGRTEYKRIIDTTSDLGVQTLLYGPANNEISRMADDTDDWNWEHVLWLGLGQQIRQGKWDVETSPIPASVTEMLDYGKTKNVKLLAYVYPSVPFSQDPSWLVTDPKKKTRKLYATLASRKFQDFLVHQLIVFKHRTGIAGYSFDYAFLTVPGSTPYAQWWGWRRVTESLRQAEPDIIIDGRQTYQAFGPWSWLAGNYPHPTGNDEQPESFVPYPDLHFDRVSANRTRFVNYWYRNYQFAPTEVVPGYMTHQTERSVNLPPDDLSGGKPQNQEIMYTTYRARDWDYLGYRYSVISSIATAGWNNLTNMLPARDMEEFSHFAESDKAWIRGWLQWASEHKDYLQETRTILGQPAIGRVDGTSAVIRDRGYLFLFNPNYKELAAKFRLDPSIGLTKGDQFLLRELYPREGALIGKGGTGTWRFGDTVPLNIEGTSARVLEVVPLALPVKKPLVFGSASSNSTATTDGAAITLENVVGEPGSTQEVGVLLSDATPIKSFSVNGNDVAFTQSGAYASSAVKFAGQKFTHSEQIKLQAGGDGVLAGTFVVPKRIFMQLAERRKNWPIPWTKDDYTTTWLVPERLLLYLQIAEPKDTLQPQITIDGHSATFTKAYASVRVDPSSFVGFYLDLSQIEPDVEHRIELKLPVLRDGQFLGLSFDNVEAEYTQAMGR